MNIKTDIKQYECTVIKQIKPDVYLFSCLSKNKIYKENLLIAKNKSFKENEKFFMTDFELEMCTVIG